MCQQENTHCHDFLSTLSEYVDGDLSPELCAELERHMCECQHCRIVVDTMRKTVELYHDLPEEPGLPNEVRSRLFACLDLEDFRKNENEKV